MNLIYNRRLELGLSQYTVADQAGIARSTYAQYEMGRLSLKNAKWIVVERLASVLQCSARELFNDEEVDNL